MPIFKNSGIIDCGVEICAMAEMLPMMSSGIGAFEQVRWDLEARGLQSGDIPVLIIGIAPDIYPLGSRHAMALAEPQQQDLYEKALMPALNPNSTFELDRMENLPYYTLKYIEATGFPLPPDLILPTKTSRKSPGPRGKPGPKKKTGP